MLCRVLHNICFTALCCYTPCYQVAINICRYLFSERFVCFIFSFCQIEFLRFGSRDCTGAISVHQTVFAWKDPTQTVNFSCWKLVWSGWCLYCLLLSFSPSDSSEFYLPFHLPAPRLQSWLCSDWLLLPRDGSYRDSAIISPLWWENHKEIELWCCGVYYTGLGSIHHASLSSV